MGTVTNVKLEPMLATWGADVAQVATITCVADSADSLDGTYFFAYTAANATKYHFWFNTSGGSATDPAPGGSTAQAVAITTGDTASAVATALASAIDGLAGFVATASGAVVTVTNAATGYATLPHDGGDATGFTFALSTEGDSAADVGLVEGDMEVAIESSYADITAHQSGTDLLGQIQTGKNVSITLNFKETSVAQLRKVLTKAGGQAFTPAGAGATEVFGLGQSEFALQRKAAKLVLHPKVLGSSDHSRDITFWKAAADLESLTFSGENIFMLPVTFQIFPDTTKNERINKMVYGDATQTLTA
jgi:hypothetical protein